MGGRRFLTMVLGGLMALNAIGAAVPMMAAAEAAVQRDWDSSRHDEFNRAIRAEHDRHESAIRAIRDEYQSDHHELQIEMKKERERHEAEMKEIHRKYFRHEADRSD